MKNRKRKIVIAGAGPAGSSLAIRMREAGHEVSIIERERFPRHKLCGEFVSPECIAHFRDLGVLARMESVGGDRILQTTFFSVTGKSVTVPSSWFGSEAALSISRAAMDEALLARAREVGVEVIEAAGVSGVSGDAGVVRSIEYALESGSRYSVEGDIFIDATGRSRTVSKLASRRFGIAAAPTETRKLIGFKAHLDGARVEPGNCEIYFFENGYGGLSLVENGVANHCFLVEAESYKRAGSVDALLESVVFRNIRAREMLSGARPIFDWMAVAVSGFGRRELVTGQNVFAVGDAAAFIDPFTGSGMLLALEGSLELSAALAESDGDVPAEYTRRYTERFSRRLAVCGLLRSAAFWPKAAGTLIGVLGFSQRALRILAGLTRSAGAVGNVR